MSNWYLQNGKESDVVISTRIRLARNLSGFPFENKCDKEAKKQILNKIEEIVPNIGYGLQLLKMKDMNELTKEELIEKHLISPDFANKDDDARAIIINNEENICIMVNEEDHIRIQVFSEGLETENLLNLAIELDKKLEKLLNYSYSDKYGYLTACPTNVGTGLRVSTMVHVPALDKTENLGKILRIVNNFGMSVRGVYGEGSDSKGNIYQISNNQTLGLTEEEIAKDVLNITQKVIEQERIARKYLGKTGLELENKLYRAFGLMMYSKMITLDECMDLLSDVKLGTDMGIIKELDDGKIKKLLLYTKPANMQRYYGQTMGKNEENIKRAELAQQIISEK